MGGIPVAQALFLVAEAIPHRYPWTTFSGVDTRL